MSDKFLIHVPTSEIETIKHFLAAPIDDLKRAARCIAESPPTPDVEDLSEICSTTTGIATRIVEDLVTIAVNLNRVQRDTENSPETTLNMVATFLASRVTDWQNTYAQAWSDRANVIGQLLIANGPIEIMSKARELLHECQTVFLDSAVLTDVRYIYNADATAILGGLVVNTLTIGFLEGRSETRQLHVVVTEREIEKLISQLHRAQRKLTVTKELLQNTALAELTPKRDT